MNTIVIPHNYSYKLYKYQKTIVKLELLFAPARCFARKSFPNDGLGFHCGSIPTALCRTARISGVAHHEGKRRPGNTTGFCH
jgi:hypothetical protein